MNMKRLFCCAGLLMTVWVCQAQSDRLPTPEQMRKIEAAIPNHATAQPKKPRKVLLYTRTDGFRHASIPHGIALLTMMGKMTGAYRVTHTEDVEAFTAENLAKFDAICFCNTTGENFSGKTILEDFLADGKGIIGIHAATDFDPAWDGGMKLYCGRFDGHPWNANGTWDIQVEDPEHLLVAAFEKRQFKHQDEIYRHKTDKLRDHCRVLVGLDMTSPVNLAAEGVRPEDRDIPISWVRRIGAGRLFVSNFGHNEHTYWHPQIVRHYLDGIQFALGDLDDVQTAPLPFKDHAGHGHDQNNSTLPQLLALKSYEYGRSRKPAFDLELLLQGAQINAELAESIEAQMIDFLRGDGTLAGKQQVCRILREHGTEQSSAALSELLSDPQTADMARFALQAIPGERVDRVLIEAIGKADKSEKIGLIGTVAARKQSSALETLAQLMKRDDQDVARAAIAAVGRIGTQKAVSLLSKAQGSISVELKEAVNAARLHVADGLLAAGDAQAARRLYEQLYSTSPADALPDYQRMAAFIGTIRSDQDTSHRNRAILAALEEGGRSVKSAASELLAKSGDDDLAASAAALFSNLPPQQKVQLLTAFADGGFSSVLPAVRQAAADESGDVQYAAIDALGQIGKAEDALLLAKLAAQLRGTGQQLARHWLDRLNARRTNRTILQSVNDAEDPVKIELLRSIGSRLVQRGDATLVSALDDDNPRVVRQALKSLQDIGTRRQLDAVVTFLLKQQLEGLRKEGLRTVASIISSDADADRLIDRMVSRYESAQSADARGILLDILGQTGADRALPVLVQALHDSDLRLTALRQLRQWPNGKPGEELLELAGSNEIPANVKSLALLGHIRLIGLQKKPDSDKLRAYQRAMSLCTTAQQRQLVLSGLGQLRHVDALTFAAESLADQEIAAEAQVACVTLCQTIGPSNRQTVRPILQQVIAQTSNPDLRVRAERLLERLD